MSWRLVSRRALELLHDENLAEHGGRPGLRDGRWLESALAGPQPLPDQDEPDLADRAAACGCGLIRKPAFVGANERAAFVAVGLFLALNGQRLCASQSEASLTMLALAAGHLSQDEFAHWLRQHMQARPR